jgi:hypothetical protein
MWIGYGLLGLFFAVTVFAPSPEGYDDFIQADRVWASAGHLVFMPNIFMPLLAGILAADRMQRDLRLGVRELQRSAPFSLSGYIAAKYLGVLASVLAPILLWSLGAGLLVIFRGQAPVEILWPLLLAFLSIAVPSHAFVVAFSLACPLVMPLRVYQVLFTGYWFWGNLLSPKAFPTISHTLLNAVGQYPLQGFFGMYMDSTDTAATGFTAPQAILNLLVLALCIATVLFVLDRYLRWQAHRV